MKDKLSGKGLAILLTGQEIRITLLSYGRLPAKFNKRFVIPTPVGAVNDGVIVDQEAVAEAIKTALKENKLKSARKAVFSICSTQVLAESAVIPATDKKWLGKMIDTNRDVYFPVNVADHKITFKVTGAVKREGENAWVVRMWAIPQELLRQYYALANACGLSVAAIDYCGTGFVRAAGATFDLAGPAKPKLKLGLGAKKSEETPAQPAPTGEGTSVQLLAEDDFLLLTFVCDGVVTMQRYLRRSDMLGGELEEARLSMALYATGPEGRGAPTRAVLMGPEAADTSYAARVRETLGIETTVSGDEEEAPWLLCAGAAATELDFGVETMDKPSRFSLLSQVWQYLVFAAGLSVLGISIMALIAPQAGREQELASLQSSKAQKQMEQLEVSDYYNNFLRYQGIYDSYVDDWEAVLGYDVPVYDEDGEQTGSIYVPGVLRSYNDNLELLINELEEILPVNSSVTEIRIEENAMALQIASESEEDVVNLLLALRYKLTYGTLWPGYITSMTQGGGVSVFDSSISSAISQALAGNEPAPTEGSAGDMAEEMWPETVDEEAIEEVLSTLSPDQQTVIRGMIAKGPDGDFTSEELNTAYAVAQSLSSEQRITLATALGYDRNYGYTMDELLPEASFEVRQRAMNDTLHNPIALYRFGILVSDDLNRDPGAQVFFPAIGDDIIRGTLNKEIDQSAFQNFGSAEGMMQLAPFMLKTVVKDEENLTAATNLCRTDSEMSGYYAYYLAVAMGKSKVTAPDDNPDPDAGTTDPGTGTTDPGTDTPDPGTDTPDPDTGTTDPGTGTTDPGTQTPDPGTGTTDPGTQTPDPGTGTTDPGTQTPDPGTQTPSQPAEGWTVDPETNLPRDPSGNVVDPATSTNGLFSILDTFMMTQGLNRRDIDWSQFDWQEIIEKPNEMEMAQELVRQTIIVINNTTASPNPAPGTTGDGGEEEQPKRWTVDRVRNLPVDPDGNVIDPATTSNPMFDQINTVLGIDRRTFDWTQINWDPVVEYINAGDSRGVLLELSGQIGQILASTGTGTGTGTGDLPGGDGEPEAPPDMRYFITVVITYNDEMLSAELERDGLDRTKLVPELEVGEE